MITAALTTTKSNLEQALSKLKSQERFLDEQQAEEKAAALVILDEKMLN